MNPQPSIAHYRVTSKLGEGGMGAVYRAVDTKLNREVAIKVLPDTFASDPDRLARFTREAQVLASLNHPNIAAIYGVEERAIVLELVDGQTLAGPMSQEEALPLIHQLIDALEYAHEKGIVHRDLKPANIKVTPEGRLKVLDFGLAKALASETIAADPASSPTMTMRATMAGVIMGTAAYMSPEQARGQTVDKRADIWAFGVVLHEMLTGRPLFRGETVSDTLAAVLREDPDITAVPLRFHRLLRLCLTRDPRQRLRDISGARLLLEEPAAAIPPAAPVRNRLPWALAAILAAIAAPALWFALRPAPKTDRPLIRLNVDLGPDAIEGPRNTVVLSPDGTHMVYPVQDKTGIVRLAVRPLNQAKSQVLSGTEGASDPFFSPDGQWIGFAADGRLKKVAVQGGAAIVLGNTPTLRGAAWSHDGSIIYGKASGSGLSRLPAGGGAALPFTKLMQGEGTHRWPRFLPGERAILFVSHSQGTGFDDAAIEAMSLPKGDRAIVLKGGFAANYVPSGHLLYVHQGVLFGVGFDAEALRVRGAPVPLLDDLASVPFSAGGQYDVSANGTLVYLSGTTRDALWSLITADNTGKTQPLPIPRGHYLFPTVSRDGKNIAWVSPNWELWVYDIAREAASRLVAGGAFGQPVWTPNGKHLVFSGVPGEKGEGTLWCIRADGAGERQRLFGHRAAVEGNSFSPDGKRLAINLLGPESNRDIVMLPVDWSDPDHPKAGQPEPFLSTPAIEAQAAISPDGKWIAYRSGDGPTGEVFVQPFPGPGGRWQISNGSGMFPQWSPDGRRLFFETAENRIMVADIVVQGASLAASKPRPWMDLRLMGIGGARNYAVMADGKHLVVVPRPEQAEKDGRPHVTFLFNFFDELKRRLP